MRRHLFLLLVLTVLVRGWLYFSYPLRVSDDNQAGQLYLVDQLLEGNLLIGNLRFQTGYPLLIAPVIGAARLFGNIDGRLVLIVQIAVSSLIPFMVYDLMRVRFSPRAALIVALTVLLDPFGLQAPHYWLPEWLIAFLLVLALWLIDHALKATRRRTMLFGLSGLALGFAGLARFNFLPLILLIGAYVLLTGRAAWRERLSRTGTMLGIVGGVIALYVVSIHYPSTGTWTLNCIGGVSLLESVHEKGQPIRAENGERTREYLRLLSIPSTADLPFTAATYPLWRIPGTWVTDAERTSFLAREPVNVPVVTSIVFPGSLYFHLGPCAVDDLLQDVALEAIAADPLQFMRGIADWTWRILVQDSSKGRTLLLPTYEQLRFESVGFLNFARATGQDFTGELVWEPGIRAFSHLYPLWNLIKWLTPLALVFAFWKGDDLARLTGVLILAQAVTLAVVDLPEPRIYGAAYPLYSFLIGLLLARMAEYGTSLLTRRRSTPG
ncbi:MAG: glycosyltransferase family 39 protein [bacterium]|nr:glycosyltransferase family 39 protein [bacterium]